jgi:hypothetical protein
MGWTPEAQDSAEDLSSELRFTIDFCASQVDIAEAQARSLGKSNPAPTLSAAKRLGEVPPVLSFDNPQIPVAYARLGCRPPPSHRDALLSDK